MNLLKSATAILTLVALLIALAAPAVCAVGLFHPERTVEHCTDDCCGTTGSQPAADGQSTDSKCPFAESGICAGLVFLVESPATVNGCAGLSWTNPIHVGVGLQGFTDELMRPPARFC